MELMVIAVIALIVLGPSRLPDAARSVGKGMREMRDSFQGLTGDDDDDDEPRARKGIEEEDLDGFEDEDLEDAQDDRAGRRRRRRRPRRPADKAKHTAQTDSDAAEPSIPVTSCGGIEGRDLRRAGHLRLLLHLPPFHDCNGGGLGVGALADRHGIRVPLALADGASRDRRDRAAWLPVLEPPSAPEAERSLRGLQDVRERRRIARRGSRRWWSARRRSRRLREAPRLTGRGSGRSLLR